EIWRNVRIIDRMLYLRRRQVCLEATPHRHLAQIPSRSLPLCVRARRSRLQGGLLPARLTCRATLVRFLEFRGVRVAKRRSTPAAIAVGAGLLACSLDDGSHRLPRCCLLDDLVLRTIN